MARGIASFGPEAAWYICKLRIAQSIRRQFGRPRPVLPRRDPRGLAHRSVRMPSWGQACGAGRLLATCSGSKSVPDGLPEAPRFGFKGLLRHLRQVGPSGGGPSGPDCYPIARNSQY